MDTKDQSLYYEEQRQKLIDIDSGIKSLKPVLDKLVAQYIAPKDNIHVEGKVTVNTQKVVTVDNLEGIVQTINNLSTTLAKAIKDNSYKPLPEVTVKNLKEVKIKSIDINNLGDIQRFFSHLENVIKDNQPLISVEKQDLVLPTSASKALPVRLSDGKSFYNAIATLSSSMASVYRDSTGKGVPVTLTSTGSVPVTNPDGTNIGSDGTAPTLADFSVNDIEEATTSYFGFTKPDGTWLVKELTNTSVAYATVSNNGAVTSYTDAWADRATLTYGRFDEAF
jgi:hypothetical protein